MSNWKYTNATNQVVYRTNADGSSESCLTASISEWISEGNTPEPADPLPIIDPKDAIRAEIANLESAQLLPRVTREFMLQFTESQFTPEQLAANFGYKKLKEFDALIAGLRGQL